MRTLRGLQRIYYSMEDSETQHPEYPQTEEHLRIGGHDLQAVKLHTGAIWELVGVLILVTAWLYAEVQ